METWSGNPETGKIPLSLGTHAGTSRKEQRPTGFRGETPASAGLSRTCGNPNSEVKPQGRYQQCTGEWVGRTLEPLSAGPSCVLREAGAPHPACGMATAEAASGGEWLSSAELLAKNADTRCAGAAVPVSRC